MVLRCSPPPARLALTATLAALTLAACGGGGGGSNSIVLCGNDSQYALARPQNGQSIGAGTPTVEIVASGNNNQINNNFQNFDLVFVPANVNGYPSVPTGSLARASDPGGYQPFPSDFYYSATVLAPGLSSGITYNVYVNVFTSNCTPVGPIGQLGT